VRAHQIEGIDLQAIGDGQASFRQESRVIRVVAYDPGRIPRHNGLV
jgi:hypothetical protein